MTDQMKYLLVTVALCLLAGCGKPEANNPTADKPESEKTPMKNWFQLFQKATLPTLNPTKPRSMAQRSAEPWSTPSPTERRLEGQSCKTMGSVMR